MMFRKVMIEGMSCGHCVKRVKNALNEISGVTNVEVDLENKMAVVESNTEIDESTIRAAVDDAGYTVLGVS